MQFFQTGYGRTFFEHQLPELIKALNRNADELKRKNDLEEKRQEKETNK